MTLKDKLYYFFAEKNWGVRREYPEIKAKYDLDGIKIKKWIKLIHLNWHYRIKKSKDYLYVSENTNVNKKKKSEKTKWLQQRQIMFLVKDLLQYDVIIFDLFGTLVFQKLSINENIYSLVGDELGIQNFSKFRIAAETIARKRKDANYGVDEITIYEIYDVLEKWLDISKEEAIKIEIKTMAKLLTENPYMKRVYRLLLDQGKDIVIVADTSFSISIVEEILRITGYSSYQKIYITSEYKCSKKTSGIYHYIKNDYTSKKCIYIGDNLNDDIQCAEQVGITTEYYKNINEIGKQSLSRYMSPIVGDAYHSLVKRHLNNGIQTYSYDYEKGFVYYGIYVLGFCNWLKQKIDDNNINILYFISDTDKCFYNHMLKLLYPEIECEILLWSMNCGVKYAPKKEKFHLYVQQFINKKEKWSIKQLLEILSLDNLSGDLFEYGLTPETLILADNMAFIHEFFNSKWDIILEIYNSEKIIYQKEIRKMLISNSEIAFVAISGNESLLSDFIETTKYISDFKIKGNLYFEVMNNSLYNDIFSDIDIEQNTYVKFSAINKKELINELEIISSSEHGSCYYGINKNGDYVFSIESLNLKNEDLHNGILDFCKMYTNSFECINNYVRNISVNDAIGPITYGLEKSYLKEKV